MSRNPELEAEAVLQAKFDLDFCADEKLTEFRRVYEELLDRAVAKAPSSITRDKLEEALREAYREYRRTRINAERARLSRLR